MTGHIPKSSWLRVPDQNHVIIIGAGPVGLVSSLFLSKYQIPHVLVEKRAKPDNHPQAHFINCRSMEILRELDGLDQAIYDHSAPVEQWRRFVYCTGLADLPTLNFSKQKWTGSLLGMVDHFADVRDEPFSPARVMHFPQHDFVCLLRKAALKSRFCKPLEGYRAEIKEHRSHVRILLTDDRNGRRWHLKTQYVVAADGAHSSTRKQLGIDLVSKTGTLQHLINVHFFSQQLAKGLQHRIPAMLYFIYSKAGVAVLIAHSFRRGEFAAQIPFFPPYQRIEDFGVNRCAEMLQKLAGQSIDVDVRSIRNWRMGIWLASRLRSKWGRCFLIGDAAHQFTPAGGFGMNTGIQDAHNLIWKLALVIRSENSTPLRSSERLLTSYEQERKPIVRLNAKISVENYRLTLKIPRAIGLNLNLLQRLLRLISRFPGLYPLKRCLFQWAMFLGLKQVEWLKFNSAIARQRRRTV
ncbi:MAG: FAD-dependent monooxygenase, partial [Desulfobacterales bacterium]